MAKVYVPQRQLYHAVFLTTTKSGVVPFVAWRSGELGTKHITIPVELPFDSRAFFVDLKRKARGVIKHINRLH